MKKFVLIIGILLICIFNIKGVKAYDWWLEEDLRFPVSNLRLPTSNPPTIAGYKGGEVFAFSKITDNTCYITAQMPHDWSQGTSITPHLHWAIPAAGLNGANPENVRWVLTLFVEQHRWGHTRPQHS